MRMAMLSSSARLAMLPTCMLAGQAAAPRQAVAGHAPQRRHAGNSRNSTTMMGAPSQAMVPAVRAACASGGLAHRHVALTSAVSSPSRRHQHGGGREQRLREEEVREHREEAQEEDHERIAPGAQLQRLERQQHHDQRHAGVAPQQRAVGQQGGRRPCQQASSHQRPGSGRAVQASQPRHSSTPAARPAAPPRQVAHLRQHHPGDHASRNSVSRASRGRA
jgi:hypothetical protein